jgi:hypothetical protein
MRWSLHEPCSEGFSSLYSWVLGVSRGGGLLSLFSHFLPHQLPHCPPHAPLVLIHDIGRPSDIRPVPETDLLTYREGFRVSRLRVVSQNEHRFRLLRRWISTTKRLGFWARGLKWHLRDLSVLVKQFLDLVDANNLWKILDKHHALAHLLDHL